jgi:hypothetical protein
MGGGPLAVHALSRDAYLVKINRALMAVAAPRVGAVEICEECWTFGSSLCFGLGTQGVPDVDTDHCRKEFFDRASWVSAYRQRACRGRVRWPLARPRCGWLVQQQPEDVGREYGAVLGVSDCLRCNESAKTVTHDNAAATVDDRGEVVSVLHERCRAELV